MVCLPGFTASPAEEVKSRPYAFKVYHTGTMFYFAAETNFELSVWLDAITTATLGPSQHAEGRLHFILFKLLYRLNQRTCNLTVT